VFVYIQLYTYTNIHLYTYSNLSQIPKELIKIEKMDKKAQLQERGKIMRAVVKWWTKYEKPKGVFCAAILHGITWLLCYLY
jgi:hypothetical protein